MPEFTLTTLTPQPFAHITLTSKIADMPRTMGDGFAGLARMFNEAGAEMAGMPMAHYLDYDGGSTTFELGFPCRPDQAAALQASGLSIGETASGRVMTGVHMGPYESVPSTYNAMMAAMGKQGLTGAKDMWEVYFSPPETPPEEIKTEVIWPVS